VIALLPQVFAWASKKANPGAGLLYQRSLLRGTPRPDGATWVKSHQIQLRESIYVITFHKLQVGRKNFKQQVSWLKRSTNRPVICTEYNSAARFPWAAPSDPTKLGLIATAGAASALINSGIVGRPRRRPNLPWESWRSLHSHQPPGCGFTKVRAPRMHTLPPSRDGLDPPASPQAVGNSAKLVLCLVPRLLIVHSNFDESGPDGL